MRMKIIGSHLHRSSARGRPKGTPDSPFVSLSDYLYWRIELMDFHTMVTRFRERALNEEGLTGLVPRVGEEKVIRESDETRLFQVNLKLQVLSGLGGGIEAKLNRIRAISGVTVVGHEEGLNVGEQRFVVVKVKFHPHRDSLRAETYVWEVLVPQINSTKFVPGIRVVDVIDGTLKRLDKK